MNEEGGGRRRGRGRRRREEGGGGGRREEGGGRREEGGGRREEGGGRVIITSWQVLLLAPMDLELPESMSEWITTNVIQIPVVVFGRDPETKERVSMRMRG